MKRSFEKLQDLLTEDVDNLAKVVPTEHLPDAALKLRRLINVLEREALTGDGGDPKENDLVQKLHSFFFRVPASLIRKMIRDVKVLSAKEFISRTEENGGLEDTVEVCWSVTGQEYKWKITCGYEEEGFCSGTFDLAFLGSGEYKRILFDDEMNMPFETSPDQDEEQEHAEGRKWMAAWNMKEEDLYVGFVTQVCAMAAAEMVWEVLEKNGSGGDSLWLKVLENLRGLLTEDMDEDDVDGEDDGEDSDGEDGGEGGGGEYDSEDDDGFDEDENDEGYEGNGVPEVVDIPDDDDDDE
uniref:Uncharacterized protein n=1 Tax=Chromera velia CCMP2878 TaxID=1169474 RepID=A0A0G4HHZ3_9ALVE|mmetsp:Transcript_11006/g.21261  ORF Transcript_11006/g.21261 Transcript_11006/m.21261 type:complete len:296 (+) Transcript_11006:311-1198(+)|eukprot:Cvel_6935.t1-p1 / transcript=Cvel_6935.t1 / gene=Cvel_6935 / organism=Chromera_velia_CCMP2878 / gene_product=hypothetical protein / transcript_product=hypothetical protein / location=Cvel_scaffold351:27045-27929(-) / protein_length=295 / sequence_SO=supercontig / SO=protein_coding / is_pseudo=false